MFDTTVTLYSETITLDAALNEVKTYKGTDVPVRRTRSITRNEYYQAAAQGLAPAAVLVVFFGDYNGEKIAKWQGKFYRISRTYQKPDRDDLELTLEDSLEFLNGLDDSDGEESDGGESE